MNQDTQTAIDFEIQGITQTENDIYAILIDSSSLLYFPITCGEEQATMISGLMSDELQFNVQNFGLYFTFASLMKANGTDVTEVAITVGKNKTANSYLDLVQENELGMKVSRIPIMMADAVVFCAIFHAPVVVYGSAGTDFAFAIDKNIPKQSIFAFISEDIAKAERLMLLRQDDEEDDE